MDQVTVADALAPTPVIEVGKSNTAEPIPRDARPPDDVTQIEVLLRGSRLQITADIDAAGLAKLKDVHAKYEETLKLLK